MAATPTGRPSLLPSASLAGFLGVHLDPLEVDALIAVHGNECEYRRGQLCPCFRVETGQAAIGCPACRGLGWTYPESMRCRTAFLDHSKTAKGTMEGAGNMVQGEAQVTFRIGVVPGRGDLVLPDCEEHIVHEQFTRAVQQISQRDMRSRLPPGGLTRPLPPRSERLLYPDPFEVEAVSYLRGEEAVIATPDVDYRVAPLEGGTTIAWIGSRGPAPGEGYTVRYIAQAAYMVQSSPPNFRHEGAVAMPYRATLERLDKLQERDLR